MAMRLDSRSGDSWLDGVDVDGVGAAVDPDELADPPGKSCPAANSVASPLKGWALISDCSWEIRDCVEFVDTCTSVCPLVTAGGTALAP
jgi:hypothetical protein